MKVAISLLFFSLLFNTSLYSQHLSGDNYFEDYLCEKGLEIDTTDYLLLYNDISEWLNTPYKYAGNSLTGIDCSGFTKKIYEKTYNINLLGGSSSLFTQVTPIPLKEDLCEGDLIFFKIKKNKISHVGIYLKDGNFIHASVQNGVIISNLNETYYNKYYFSGGRIP